MTPIKTKLQEVCRGHQVQVMYAYGTRAAEIKRVIDGKGSVNRDSFSDVDIGIKTSRGSRLSVKDKVKLVIELEDLLDIERVDLAVIPEVDPFVATNIIRGERLYCEDPYMTDEYELYVLRRAGDLAPFERDRLSMIFRESI